MGGQTRRAFLGGTLSLGAVGLLADAGKGFAPARPSVPFADVDPYTEDLDGVTWWKGDTHMHTLLSDGLVFPAEAAALYRRLGYNFIVFTDHDVTPPADGTWITDQNRYYDRILTPDYFARFKRNFPELYPEVRVGKNGKKEYRVLPFDELAAKVNVRGRFLIVPGNEVTYIAKNGENLHCSLLNLRKPCHSRRYADVPACLDDFIAKRDALVPPDNPDLTMAVICHPLWTAYDVRPDDAIRHPSIRFFEVNNAGSMVRYQPLPPGDCFTHDRWWDAVNATRATLGQPLIYGTSGDDQHHYETQYEGTVNRPGFVRVASKELTLPALMTAFWKGNFYSSSGIELKSVRFDRAKNTLSVSVKPEPGRRYRIIFIGSKRGCETDVRGYVKWHLRNVTPGDLKLGYSPDRRAPYYSPAVGAVLKVSDSTDSSYTMQSDDLYVRAKIVTDLGVLPEDRVQTNPIAWTQPVLNRR